MLTDTDAARRSRIDQMVVAMSRYVADGDLLGEGIGTFLSNAAYMLARHTHAPRGVSLCPNGNTLMCGPRPLSLGQDEALTLGQALVGWDYVDVNLAVMPSAFIDGRPRWTEFMRPAQIDAYGWTNNVQIGRDGGRRIRLPGAAGIPDATSVSRRVFYYVPRHTTDVFVKQLDHISGVGNLRPGQSAHAHTPKTVVVVTELCVMTSDAQGALDVVSLHRGVTGDQVQAVTGFVLPWRLTLQETVPPTTEQIRLLNEVIDPQGLRFLESLSGRDRRQRLRALVRRDAPVQTMRPEVNP